jgi:oligoendopeptidase F
MKGLALAAALAASTYQVDLTHYFPNPTAEQTDRAAVLRQTDAFVHTQTASLDSPQALLSWLTTLDRLSKALHRHDIYVYLRAERDSGDHADAAADTALGNALDRLDDAAARDLASIAPAKLASWFAASKALVPYRNFIAAERARAVHTSRNADAIALLAVPTLDSLAEAYKALRPATPASGDTESAAAKAFAATWAPYAKSESAFAALLIPIVHLQDGKAQLAGFSGAPEAAYFANGLTTTEVENTLAALRGSDAYRRYETVIANAAARRLKLPPSQLHPWDLTFADSYRPQPVPFAEALSRVIAAEQPMGREYADQFARLLDPANHRVEWCDTRTCDAAGFSLGFAGSVSSLFYGAYKGTTDNVRAVAHEAGHAVHRQFMNENQPLAVYNEGPHLLFESFAIFNGFLLEDHLVRTAVTPEARAYYLHRFLEDAVFNVYGSAKETALESAIYAGVRRSTLHNAAGLDALTLKIIAENTPAIMLAPEMKNYWAYNRLYFTDPLYDVNYLFAGLLALEYLKQFEEDPHGFAQRYVAFLKNGLTDTPRVLEKRFLAIDLDDAPRLATDAASLIDKRTTMLAALYKVCDTPVACSLRR